MTERPPTETDPADPAPALAVAGLSYVYPGGGFSLREIGFVLQPGEIVGLIGPSGAGKSTLLMHLNGLLPERVPDDPQQAFVQVEGLPLVREHLQEIRRRVGFLFQDPDDQLFCPTVREDVAFGPLNLGLSQAEARARMQEALRAVGLEEYEYRSTIQLSLGERKRVCLAGVLACRPHLLALDEPFSNLDPRNRNGLIDILREFEGAQLIATHDLEIVARLCSRVIVIDDGLIRADGRPGDVLRDAGLMARHGLEVPWSLRS